MRSPVRASAVHTKQSDAPGRVGIRTALYSASKLVKAPHTTQDGTGIDRSSTKIPLLVMITTVAIL